MLGAVAQPPQPSEPTFRLFPRLPTELRVSIWNMAEDSQPGHVIEICNIPAHWDNAANPNSFEWYAVPCGCEKRCLDPPLARVNHESREIALKRRLRCFDRWVDWEKDIIYIGDRVGHLHNTGFLQALEKHNCREKLKYLAIDYGCWDHSHYYPCTRRTECTPAAMISRLPKLQQLIFAKTSGAWRDGNEKEYHEPCYFTNRYRDVGNPDYDFEGDHVYFEQQQFEIELFDMWRSKNGFNVDDVWIDLPEKVDRWRCEDTDGFDDMLGSCKAVVRAEAERKYSFDGNCGIALVPLEKIDRGYWWDPDVDGEIPFIQDWVKDEFDKLKFKPRNKAYGDPDYTTWTPPEIKITIIRKTAPSCFTSDWDGLEQDWMTYAEACWARDFPTSYEARDKSKDYPPEQHFSTYSKLYSASDLALFMGG